LRSSSLALQVLRRLVPSEWGGIESVVVNPARQLPSFGYSAEILCTRALADREREDVQGLPVHRFDYFYPVLGLDPDERRELDGKGGNPVSLPLHRALLDWPQPALIHVHTAGRIAGVARSAARARGIPYVVTLHGGHFTTPRAENEAMKRATRGHLDYGRLFGFLFGARRFLEDAAAVICISKAEFEAAQARLPGQRIALVPNGVDVESVAHGDGRRFRAVRGLESSRIVLCVARIDYQKNQLALVRAIGRVRQRFPSAVCVLVGPVSVPTYRDALEAEAKKAGQADALRILGALPPDSPELADAFAAADVVALPSLHEPFGIVVLEAWGASRPIVASRVGGLVDLIEDGESGLFGDPEDAESFATAIERVLGDPVLADRLARAGRRKSESFSWQATASQVAAIYDEALRG
jgi:glycosyltransferase involved in cell wall biosynthesis